LEELRVRRFADIQHVSYTDRHYPAVDVEQAVWQINPVYNKIFYFRRLVSS